MMEQQSSLVAAPGRAPNAERANPPVVVTSAPVFDERGLMTELRALRLNDPARALQLATQANVEHPGSPDAAERAWIAVRSLEDLRRFHEAQDVARDMLLRYPRALWTEDVERHVLLHPLDLPSREEQQASVQHTVPY